MTTLLQRASSDYHMKNKARRRELERGSTNAQLPSDSMNNQNTDLASECCDI
jgi:hypothetical protein